MDTRRLLIAALLSLAVMIIWGYLFPPPEPPQREAPPAPTVVEPRPEAVQAPPPPPPETEVADQQLAGTPPATLDETGQTAPIAADSEQRVAIMGDRFRAEITNRGAQLLAFQLLEHTSSADEMVNLVRDRAAPPYPFGLIAADGTSAPLNEALFEIERETGERGEQIVLCRYRGPLGEAVKRFVFRADGLVEVDIEAPGTVSWYAVLGPGIRNPSEQELKSRFTLRSVVYRHTEGLERIDPGRLEGPQVVATTGLRWIGLQDTYFLTAVVPGAGLRQFVVQPAVVRPGAESQPSSFELFEDEEALSELDGELERELFVLLEPEADRLAVVAFLGAKEYERLAALPYGLEETVELGWFKFLALPLLWGLQWIHENLVANYGWAIILMTLVIRVLLFPLTHKSTVSMQKMQEINPKVQALRQRYRGKLKDKQGRPNAEVQRKMNEEMMALYKAEGVNPAGGCLPMLLQIPVLFAFYRLLSSAIEIRHAPWIFWIEDLSAKDPYYVLPIVMGATQMVQQKMTPPAGDPMQRRMFALMPIFFTVLFLGFPSGLVLYWLTNNVLGIGQQAFYKRWREAKSAADKEPKGDSRRRAKRGAKK